MIVPPPSGLVYTACVLSLLNTILCSLVGFLEEYWYIIKVFPVIIGVSYMLKVLNVICPAVTVNVIELSADLYVPLYVLNKSCFTNFSYWSWLFI